MQSIRSGFGVVLIRHFGALIVRIKPVRLKKDYKGNASASNSILTTCDLWQGREMDFWILPYPDPPDSSDSYLPATDTVKKRFHCVRGRQTTIR